MRVAAIILWGSSVNTSAVETKVAFLQTEIPLFLIVVRI